MAQHDELAINSGQERVSKPIPTSTTRAFHEGSNSHYLLPCDQQEAERLNRQHQILKEGFEGRCLLVPLPADHSQWSILDSGTGAGSWILDVASQLPSAKLHGIDIETRLFPKSKPSNVLFSEGSITDLPQEWGSKFNLVHQRLLYAALKRAEWSDAIRSMNRVLQPGGWVQLGESENDPVCAGNYTKQFYGILKDLHDYYGLDISIHEELRKLLLGAGFCDVKIERRSFPLGQWAGEKGIENRNNLIEVYRGMKQRIPEVEGLNKVHSEAEFDELLDNVQNEWDSIKGTEIVFRIIFAMKPRRGESERCLTVAQ